jgi:hypothetical protein
VGPAKPSFEHRRIFKVDQFGQVSDAHGSLEAYSKVRFYKSTKSELVFGVDIAI